MSWKLQVLLAVLILPSEADLGIRVRRRSYDLGGAGADGMRWNCWTCASGGR